MKTVITLLIFAVCLNANAQVCYNPATNFAVGSLPTSIANADFNCDGIEDLVVGNPGSDNVSVLLGTGSGNFGAPTNYATGVVPMSVGVGDFNGDGKADLAVCNWTSNTVSVFLGTGTGTFGAATNYAVGAESCSVVSEDFNRDGKTDLAVSNRGSNTLSILLGTGTGTFGAANNFAVGSQPRHLTKADFNGDGIIDLVTANYGSNTISVILGTGTGSFGTAANFVAGSSPHSVACEDYNRDGKVDLAVANIYSNNISLLMGTGNGTFGAATNYAVGVNPESIITTDVNGDGMIDLAVANTNSNNVSVLLGTGTGSFAAAINFAAGVQPSYIISADLNNDGKDDLVAENYGSNNVSVLLNCTAICTGSYGPAYNLIADTNPRFIINKDLDKDGKADLIVANQTSNNVSILMGLGAGNFSAPTNYTVGDLPVSTTIEDFNQDGISDLAVANFNSDNVSILLGTGTGSFGLATNISAGNGTAYIISRDFNKDGIADIAVTNYYSNSLSIFLGIGLGSFGTATDFALDSGPNSITSADFNEDGNADLAITNYLSDNVSVLLGTGTGSFGAANNFMVGESPNSVTCADFNWDGKIDLAIANRNSDNVSVLLGTGTGSFGAVTNFAVGDTPWSVINDDLNRDGNPDLVVTNQNSDNISILLGTGTGNFSVAENISTDPGPISLTNADFNMDGKTDLAVAINESNNVSVLLNLSLPNLSAGADQAVCTGTSVSLSGSGAVTYEWSNGVTDGTPFTPLTTRTYTVTGTDVAGCTNTDTVVVTVNSLPLDLTITNGLVAYYPFNSNANDESGNGNNGTLYGPLPVADREANPNRAYNFDGIDDYILVNDPVPLSLQIQDQITLSAWIYATQYPGTSNLGLIVGSQCDSCGGPQGASIFLDGRINSDGQTSPTGHIHFQIGDGAWHVSNTNSQVPLNQWVHIVASRKANEAAKIYYNGVLQPLTSDIWTGSVSYTGAYFAIGRQRDYSNRFFNGSVDEVRVYNRALSESEIYVLYQDNVSLVAFADFDTICENNSTNINLKNTEDGVSYQLQNNGIDYGSPQTGYGDTLTFNTGLLTSTSIFTLKATDTTTYCNIILDTIFTIMVSPAYAFTLNDTICDGETYSWQGSDYTTANTYIASYSTINGCDSIYTLNLTVNSVDVSVTVNDPLITANAIGAIYQWLDCDDAFSPINNATLQSYNATENGNYAVFIIQGACSDTSTCVQITNVGFASFTIERIVIYPNPVSNELIIEIKGNNEKKDFEILNTIGQVVFNGNIVEKTTVQTSNFAPGVYLIKLENGKTFKFKKIIKE